MSFLGHTPSPGAVAAIWRINAEIDVRHTLPAIHIPTLVIQRSGDLAVRAENARYLADHIHGAKYVELPGHDHLLYVGHVEAILNEAQEFVTGVRPVPEGDRMLATVLFTNIVASTVRAAELEDRRWRELLEDLHGGGGNRWTASWSRRRWGAQTGPNPTDRGKLGTKRHTDMKAATITVDSLAAPALMYQRFSRGGRRRPCSLLRRDALLPSRSPTQAGNRPAGEEPFPSKPLAVG